MTTTTSTVLANSQESFAHSLAVGQALSVPMHYRELAWFADLSMNPTKTWRSTSRTDVDDAVVVPEGDDLTDAAQTNSKVDISVQTLARSMLVTYEADWFTWIAEMANAGSQTAQACMRKIDSLLITDTTPNLTDEQGDFTTVMDYDQLVSFKLMFETKLNRNPPQGAVVNCVMHSGPFNALVRNMVQSPNNVFASTFGAQQVGGVIETATMGAVYRIAGIRVMVSDRVPAADVSGKGNFFSVRGPQGREGEVASTFGIAVKKGITPELRATELKLALRSVNYTSVGVGTIRDDYGMLAVTAAA